MARGPALFLTTPNSILFINLGRVIGLKSSLVLFLYTDPWYDERDLNKTSKTFIKSYRWLYSDKEMKMTSLLHISKFEIIRFSNKIHKNSDFFVSKVICH